MVGAVVDSNTNIVTNTIVIEQGSAWTPPTGSYLIVTDSPVNIGYTYDGNNFIAPVVPDVNP